jgi:hypothetical protein
MIEAGIRTLLLSQSSITTLVPNQIIDKTTFQPIFDQEVKEGIKPPFIAIERDSRDPMGALDGTYGMMSSEITVHCVGTSPSKADAIANAVTDYFKDYKGAAGSDTIDAVIWNDSPTDQYQPPDGSEVAWKSVDLEFTVQHH